MPKYEIAPHEAIELHEILTFKNVCLTKSVTMSALVSDDELRTILSQDVTTTQKHIKDLKGLMEQAYEGGRPNFDRNPLS